MKHLTSLEKKTKLFWLPPIVVKSVHTLSAVRCGIVWNVSNFWNLWILLKLPSVLKAVNRIQRCCSPVVPPGSPVVVSAPCVLSSLPLMVKTMYFTFFCIGFNFLCIYLSLSLSYEFMHLLVPSQGVYGRSRQHLSWHYISGSFVLLVYAAEELCPQFISCHSINTE